MTAHDNSIVLVKAWVGCVVFATVASAYDTPAFLNIPFFPKESVVERKVLFKDPNRPPDVHVLDFTHPYCLADTQRMRTGKTVYPDLKRLPAGKCFSNGDKGSIRAQCFRTNYALCAHLDIFDRNTTACNEDERAYPIVLPCESCRRSRESPGRFEKITGCGNTPEFLSECVDPQCLECKRRQDMPVGSCKSARSGETPIVVRNITACRAIIQILFYDSGNCDAGTLSDVESHPGGVCSMGRTYFCK